jgi:hypothetical protein
MPSDSRSIQAWISPMVTSNTCLKADDLAISCTGIYLSRHSPVQRHNFMNEQDSDREKNNLANLHSGQHTKRSGNGYSYYAKLDMLEDCQI